MPGLENTLAKPLPPEALIPQPTAEDRAGPKRRQILAHRVQRAEVATIDLIATIDATHTLQDVMRPDYWTQRARTFRRGSIIRCLWEDNSRFAMFLVLSAGETWANLSLLMVTEPDKTVGEDVKLDDVYKIDKVAGGFRVISKENGLVLRSNFSTKREAELFAQAEVDKRKL